MKDGHLRERSVPWERFDQLPEHVHSFFVRQVGPMERPRSGRSLTYRVFRKIDGDWVTLTLEIPIAELTERRAIAEALRVVRARVRLAVLVASQNAPSTATLQ